MSASKSLYPLDGQERGLIRGNEQAESADFTNSVPTLMHTTLALTTPMQLAIPAGPERWIEAEGRSIVRNAVNAVWTRVDTQIQLTPADVDGQAFQVGIVQVHNALAFFTAIPRGWYHLAAGQAYTLGLYRSMQTVGGSARYYHGRDYLSLCYHVIQYV